MHPFVVRLGGVLGMPRSDRGVSARGPTIMVLLSLCQQCTCAFGIDHLVCHVEIRCIWGLVNGELLALALATVASGEDAGSRGCRLALYVRRCRRADIPYVLFVAIVVNWEAGAERC